jgi:hypothetical protein
MTLLHTLRQHHRPLGRQVLLWFVLALGVAVFTPLLRPKTLELVCSASGSVRLVELSAAEPGDGTPDGAPRPHTLDCVWCLHLDAPLPPGQPLARVHNRPPQVAVVPALGVPVRAPQVPPARAPPVVS